MAEFFKRMPLSVSTNGEPVHITATTSGGANLVHTATATGYEIVWLWANNQHTASVVLNLEWTTSGATGLIKRSIPQNTALQNPLVPGFYLRGSATIKAFAAVTAVINIFGFTLRYE